LPQPTGVRPRVFPCSRGGPVPGSAARRARARLHLEARPRAVSPTGVSPGSSRGPVPASRPPVPSGLRCSPGSKRASGRPGRMGRCQAEGPRRRSPAPRCPLRAGFRHGRLLRRSLELGCQCGRVPCRSAPAPCPAAPSRDRAGCSGVRVGPGVPAGCPRVRAALPRAREHRRLRPEEARRPQTPPAREAAGRCAPRDQSPRSRRSPPPLLPSRPGSAPPGLRRLRLAAVGRREEPACDRLPAAQADEPRSRVAPDAGTPV